MTLLTTAEIPWWALALLPLDPKSSEWRVRRRMQRGTPKGILETDRGMTIWADLISKALTLAEQRPIDIWRQKAWEERMGGGDEEGGPIAMLVRQAALSSERAFVDFAGLTDDEGDPVVLADFHVHMIKAMRCYNPALLAIPLEHGKSYINSIIVPLMDWAEWANATEGRIYWQTSHVVKWITRLMAQVEHNRDLNLIFPWIRKPSNTDGSTIWGKDGFSIGGRDKMVAGKSFEPLTARSGTVGSRYSRVGADDWVTPVNCYSLNEQNKLVDYFNSAVLTMTQKLKRKSPYGTLWPSVFLCGTFYSNRDVGFRTYNDFRGKGYKTIRLDVYPEGPERPDEVLWPEGRDPAWILKAKDGMDRRSFNMRYRNLVTDEETQSFTQEWVEDACHESYLHGQVPSGCQALISFDPASGKKTADSADPAIALYGEVADLDASGQPKDTFIAHFIKWRRLKGYDFTRQCQEIVDWAREYHLPVVIENNTLQKSYKDYILKLDPGVKVLDHHTGSNVVNADSGVETFSPLFQNHRVVIHVGGRCPHDERKALCEQFLDWPNPTKKDLVMAFWFARYRLEKQRKNKIVIVKNSGLPSYLRSIGLY